MKAIGDQIRSFLVDNGYNVHPLPSQDGGVHEVGIPFLPLSYDGYSWSDGSWRWWFTHKESDKRRQNWLQITPNKVVELELNYPFSRNLWMVKQIHDYQSQTDLLRLLKQLTSPEIVRLPEEDSCWGQS